MSMCFRGNRASGALLLSDVVLGNSGFDLTGQTFD
jgi:hypothetical protein